MEKRTYTNAAEIMSAVDNGTIVYLRDFAYQVIKDSKGQYLIKCTMNGHAIGLTWMDGTTLNGKITDFFSFEETPPPPPFDRKGFIVIADNSEYYGNEDKFFIMHEGMFRWLPLSQTFDNHTGLKIGAAIAGETIELTTAKAVKVASDKQNVVFEIGDIIEAYNNLPLFNAIIANCPVESYRWTQCKVLAYTYYAGTAGTGYRTIFIDSIESYFDHNEKGTVSIINPDKIPATHIRIDADREQEILADYFKVTDYMGSNYKVGTGDKFTFTKSNIIHHFHIALAEAIVQDDNTMTFEQFQATKKIMKAGDFAAANQMSECMFESPEQEILVYADAGVIEYHNKEKGQYFLSIHGHMAISEKLEELERQLYQWAVNVLFSRIDE